MTFWWRIRDNIRNSNMEEEKENRTSQMCSSNGFSEEGGLNLTQSVETEPESGHEDREDQDSESNPGTGAGSFVPGPGILKDILDKKKMILMQSPQVIQFLQSHQRNLLSGNPTVPESNDSAESNTGTETQSNNSTVNADQER